jgi:hypothetical protein
VPKLRQGMMCIMIAMKWAPGAQRHRACDGACSEDMYNMDSEDRSSLAARK